MCFVLWTKSCVSRADVRFYYKADLGECWQSNTPHGRSHCYYLYTRDHISIESPAVMWWIASTMPGHVAGSKSCGWGHQLVIIGAWVRAGMEIPWSSPVCWLYMTVVHDYPCRQRTPPASITSCAVHRCNTLYGNGPEKILLIPLSGYMFCR